MSRKRGPGKYHDWITEEGLLKIEGWARDGLTDEQISHNIGIHPSTLYDWQKKYPEIAEALKKGKEVIDRQVENALLKRALGYEYEEVKQIIEKDKKGKDRKRIEKTVKQAIPDTTAQIFWLKNRKPEKWRLKRYPQELEELYNARTQAEIDKLYAEIDKIKGISEEIEDTTELDSMIYGDSDEN